MYLQSKPFHVGSFPCQEPGTLRLGPRKPLLISSRANRRVIRSRSSSLNSLGLIKSPPFEPPNGTFTMAHFVTHQCCECLDLILIDDRRKTNSSFGGESMFAMSRSSQPVKTRIPSLNLTGKRVWNTELHCLICSPNPGSRSNVASARSNILLTPNRNSDAITILPAGDY